MVDFSLITDSLYSVSLAWDINEIDTLTEMNCLVCNLECIFNQWLLQMIW